MFVHIGREVTHYCQFSGLHCVELFILWTSVLSVTCFVLYCSYALHTVCVPTYYLCVYIMMVRHSDYYCSTGKKSPVYGKWKEFYFIIKYGEEKMLYYEREDVS